MQRSGLVVIAVGSVMAALMAASTMTAVVGSSFFSSVFQSGCGVTDGTGGQSIVSVGKLLDPLKGAGQKTSPFGPRTNPVTGAQEGHRGQDFAAPVGTPIYAAAPGTVVAAGPASGFGDWIVIDHNIAGKKISTVYGHMYADGVLVHVGDAVTAGQHIANVGSNGQATGPHLHFEVWVGGRLTGGTAVDPIPWIDSNAANVANESTQAAPVTSAAAADTATAAQLMPAPPSGHQNSLTPTKDQMDNVTTIVGVGKGMNVPPRGWVIAVATAIQESSLHNINYGDAAGPDSRGLFQQRSSWGPESVRMDPAGAAGLFYRKMLKIPGWQSLPLTTVAQKVQISAFPDYYAKWELAAVNLVLKAIGAPPISGPGGNAADTSCIGLASGQIAAGGSVNGQKVADAALRWIGTPYVWVGGDAKGPTLGDGSGPGQPGFDCSGLALYAWAQVGVTLEHRASLQYAAGTKVPRGQEQPGDLVFFHTPGDPPGFMHHVGVYIGGGKMVEAPDRGLKVRISDRVFSSSEYVGAVRYNPGA
ncbi:peptidoglycan DD-metalloendopeptidase family protein [Fodinicola acaciae]|uniref:peptidoglycan DD-metalloendopeptidase family protein n=1 Tax=Fodinicola acaciae TaxID=2681555 RepID=UPI0013D1F41A|nr:peptidoglycan DD-metalloendopeptidase family protein [Fodinicola acaciae]